MCMVLNMRVILLYIIYIQIFKISIWGVLNYAILGKFLYGPASNWWGIPYMNPPIGDGQEVEIRCWKDLWTHGPCSNIYWITEPYSITGVSLYNNFSVKLNIYHIKITTFILCNSSSDRRDKGVGGRGVGGRSHRLSNLPKSACAWIWSAYAILNSRRKRLAFFFS